MNGKLVIYTYKKNKMYRNQSDIPLKCDEQLFPNSLNEIHSRFFFEIKKPFTFSLIIFLFSRSRCTHRLQRILLFKILYAHHVHLNLFGDGLVMITFRTVRSAHIFLSFDKICSVSSGRL